MAEIQGLRQALDNLRRFPEMVAPKGGGPINRALFRASKVWLDQVQQNAATLGPGVHNNRTGTERLSRNIVRRRDLDPEQDGHYARVFVTYSPIVYWGAFVELGTEKQPPQPFLRPALDQAGDKPIDVFRRFLSRDIEKIAEKLPK